VNSVLSLLDPFLTKSATLPQRVSLLLLSLIEVVRPVALVISIELPPAKLFT
jgi:hypothetical protein